MLSYREVLVRSVKIFAICAAADLALVAVVYAVLSRAAVLGTFGYAALLEAGLLLVAGGLYDWSQSEWSVGFRKITGNSEAHYDAGAHKEADRKGVALIAAAVWVFLLDLALEVILA